MLIDRLVNDTDARVRANAIEVMEEQAAAQAASRAGPARTIDPQPRAGQCDQGAAANARRRAPASSCTHMLRDARPEHRISALWALRQIGWWQLLNEVGRLAKEDQKFRAFDDTR